MDRCPLQICVGDSMRQAAHVEACCTPREAASVINAADWAITTPLLLLDILLLAGLSIGDTLWILFADIAMIVTGLFGALLPNRYKWGGCHMSCRARYAAEMAAGCCWHVRLDCCGALLCHSSSTLGSSTAAAWQHSSAGSTAVLRQA